MSAGGTGAGGVSAGGARTGGAGAERDDVSGVEHPQQARTVGVLAASQVFSGIGNGAALAVGSLLAVQLSGNEALGGTTTMAISVAGALSALPLARLALSRGRRQALMTAYALATLGSVAMLLAPVVSSFPLLLAGAFGVGFGAAGNLQARFAATDLASTRRRGQDLGLVVWSITIGAVAGPNLIGPGASIARSVGLPETSGAFLFSTAGMVVAILILALGLRPDPLVLRRDLDTRGALPEAGVAGVRAAQAPQLRAGLRAVVEDSRILAGVASVVGAHAVMVGIMAMTPVHLARLAEHPLGGGAATVHAASTDTLVVIGLVISLHIAGMYALSPLVGWAADRWGRVRVIVAGHGVLIAAAVVGTGWGRSTAAVTAALILLGIGWSLVTVAGSAYVSEHVAGARRVLVQGVTDAGMGAAAAVSAALAGVVLSAFGFAGLCVVAAVVAFALLAWMGSSGRAERLMIGRRP
ncbi:MAG: MFS transporter [Micrococcus sp.]|nr:MFS transporter [Micrococcus sp.]